MRKTLTLSLRSLASGRILAGLFILCKFIGLTLPSFAEIFSPRNGILGNCYRNDYIKVYPSPGPLFDVTSDTGMYLFIALILLGAAAYTIGFYPKISGLLLCLLLAWFNERYSVFYFGWEPYISCLLFLSVFLPVNCRFSLFPDKEPADTPSLRFFTFLLLFQVGFLYFYNGISKNGAYWMDGNAVLLAAAETDKTTAFTGLLFRYPAWARLAAWAALAWEILVLFFIFMPFRNVFFRYVSAAGIVLFHWGIALFTDVGLFKYVALVAAVILLPEHFWQLPPVRRLRLPHLKKFNVPHLRLRLPQAVPLVFGAFLLSQMVFSNLAQTSRSKTDDRLGRLIRNAGLKKTVEKGWIVRKPYYSFFGQYWHLYSPDPPAETGFSTVEGTDVKDKRILLGNGRRLQTAGEISYQKKLLFAYLTLRGNNQKDEILSRCLVSREMNLFLANPINPRLKSVELVTYSYKPQNAAAVRIDHSDYERVVRQQVNLSY